MLRFIFLLFNIIIIITTCSCINNTDTPFAKKIIIQPFEDVQKEEIDSIVFYLNIIYSNIQVAKPIGFKKSFLNSTHTRYRADSIIYFLHTITPNNYMCIGLTHKDISCTKNDITDWGVMGLGYCPGNACVASTFRLQKTNKIEQWYKVAIHELGHTEGLPHCKNKNCYMQDAEGKNKTDSLTSFCKSCSDFLIKKHWDLKKTTN